MNYALIFYLNKKNLFSFNALISYLEKHYVDEYFDFIFVESSEKLIKKVLDAQLKYKLTVVCISFCTPQIFEIEKLVSDIVKIKNDRVILISGGPHSTALPEFSLKLGFDIVVIGEGEISLTNILFSIINNSSLEDIKGIAYKKSNGDIIVKEENTYIDINETYSQSFKYKMFGPIEITRGCVFGCSFCQTSKIFGNKMRHRNIDNIINQIEILKKHNINDIRFISPSFFSYGSNNGTEINLIKIEELLRNIYKIIKPDGRVFIGTFPSEVRPEHISEETLLLIKKYCDNNNLIIGAQTGSDRLLKLYNRHHTVEDVIKAVKLTTKHNLTPNVDFIFGLPDENEEDIEKTLKIINEIVKLGARIHAHYFMPLPQTRLWNKKPKILNKKILSTINKLSSHSLLYGQWKMQEKISFDIYNYFSKTY